MFGGRDPFGDPFDMFGNLNRQMRDMDRVVGQMFIGPLEMLNMPQHRMLPEMPEYERRRRQAAGRDIMYPMGMMSPYGFGGGFFGGLMGQMHNIQAHAMNDPNSHVYSQSTFISYNGSGNGQPHVVQSSLRKAGDATETRRSVHRGGEAEEMSVGHRIGNRAHTIEKKRDASGRLRTEQKYENIGVDDAERFDQEFERQVRRHYGYDPYDPSSVQAAIDSGHVRSNRHRDRARDDARGGAGPSNGPIITIPDDDEEPDRPSSNTRARERRRENLDDVVYANTSRTSVTIQEITDDESEVRGAKRRRRR
uniref:Myeloid leukemia factor n=1 Tax=Steinernema glaseri TaxID=37863 RepID=A0A1I7Z474_9BILA